MVSTDSKKDIFKEGYDLYKLGKFEEAIKCYNKVLDIDPKDIDALNNKGIALGKLGKLDEAIKCYDKASKINPE
ncbi:MAG: tetratricopeptide repeat protein [Nitrososphaerales archaeon]|nr:tetratricopeptide repeat protein [Nitrososphaerales archaeon]MDP7658063.1 tetratricopeptide repeat protein [Nitrososphaerales archaeon]HJN57701.1 tetratricopeptide repeat protein [Nitrososphaerales archaeon]